MMKAPIVVLALVLPSLLGYAFAAPSIVMSPVAFVADGVDGFEELGGPKGITTVTIGSSTYALVAAYDDDGVQIINITDPYDPNPVAAMTDGVGGFEHLENPRYVTTAAIGSSTYALVTGATGDGIQIIDITAPSSPAPVAHIDSALGIALIDPRGVATLVVDSSTYALVGTENAVQIIDITDPYNPSPAATVLDGIEIDSLAGVRGITTTTIGSSTYALAAANHGDAVHIINVTDPSSPSPVATAHNSQDTRLDGANDVTAVTIDSSTYALVAAHFDNAIQVINITDPSSPVPVAFVQDGSNGFDHLDYPESVTITTFGSSTYALVASFIDGIQVINITDPSNPTPAGSVDTLDARFGNLSLPEDIVVTTIDSKTYALAAAYGGNGVPIIDVALTFGPLLTSASLEEGTGIVRIEFLNAVDVTPATMVDLSGLVIHDSGQSVTLTGATLKTVADSAVISIEMTGDQRRSVAALASPLLDISGSAVTDTSGNPIYPSLDNIITVNDTAAPEIVSATLDQVTGILEITFSDRVDVTPATNVYLGGMTVSDSGQSITLTGATLKTVADSAVISIEMTGDQRRSVAALASPLLGMGYYDIIDTDGNPIQTTSGNAITISNANGIPAVASIKRSAPATEITSERILVFEVTFSENVTGVDLADFVLSSSGTGTGSVTNLTGSGSAYHATVSATQDGTYNLDVAQNSSIEDAAGNPLAGTAPSPDQSFTVVSANTAPVLNAIPDQAVDELSTLTFVAGATDGDTPADTLTYGLGGAPAGASINPATGVFSWTPTEVQGPGTYTFNVTVSDGDGGEDSQAVTIDVSDSMLSPFITTWQTAAAGESITIPVGGALGTYAIDWGDGSTSLSVTGDQTHTYDDAGTYTVSISGDFTKIALKGQQPNADKLQSIEQWGDTRWESMRSAFHGASNMAYSATDTPNLSGVTIMSRMFYGAASFNGDISDWDVSSVTDMGRMFAEATSFNQPLDSWNVSSVTDMHDVFAEATSFNQPLNSWDVSSVTKMNGMFAGATSFNGSISNWNVSSVNNMYDMFWSAPSFNQPLDSWDVSSVTDMHDMLFGASSFNQPLDSWDVSSVTDMYGTFSSTHSFNQPLDSWDVLSVTNMFGMFSGASSFNQPLDSWDVSSVTGMSHMFSGASSFNQPLNSWDVSSVTDMNSMFGMATSFDSDISDWDVSSVTDMNSMFFDADSFDQNLGKWYIVLNDMTIDYDDAPGIVGNISTQNSFLDGQNPAYGIGSGGDSYSFELNGSSLVLKAAPAKRTYTVNMTSTGDFGTGNSKMIEITVSGFNASPTVNAGEDQTVREGQIATLSGTATDVNGDSLTYAWSHDSAPAIQLTNSTSPSTTFIAPAVGADTAITFTLTADDGTATASDQVIITIDHNDPPTASAGSDQTVVEGSAVTLNGTATDIDGDPLTYSWTHDSALAIQLANSTSPSTTFTAPAVDADTEITFTLTADDGTATAEDSLVVAVTDVPAVNSPPVADAGPDQTVVEDQAVTLNGTATDIDGDPLTYLWSHDSALEVAFNASLPAATFDAPQVDADMAVTFTLAVSDGSANSTDTVLVTVRDMSGDSNFVTTWETTASGESITIPARGKYAVDWGDGTVDANVRGSQTHEYDVPGNHTVRISKGITGISLNNHADAPKLQSIDQWGEAKWRSMHSSFKGASNMILHATDAPDLSRTTEMSYMFMHAGSFDGDLSGWDVSGVTGMSGMFYNANSFNGDLSGWDVSGVTGMSGMFYNANSFNGDLSGWDVSGVTGMSGMFYNANSFNGDLSGWDVSHVTDMYSMFSGASSFDGNISAWDVSSVTDMHGMFAAAKSFNGDLSGWDVSGVENMRAMLSNADSFDRNLGKWYITLDGTAVDGDTWAAGTISAQNSFLDDQSPAYGIGTGGDSNLFEINGSVLRLKGAPDRSAGGTYTVTVTSTGDFGASNSRTLEVTVAANPGGIPAEPERGPREIGAVSLNSTAPGTVYVAWEPPSEQPLEYRITWAKSGESFPDWRDPVGNAFPAGSSHTITDLDEGEEYQIKVRARYDSSRPGDWSDVVTIIAAGTG